MGGQLSRRAPADRRHPRGILKERFGRIACLSNDVSAWSIKLRDRFGMEAWIERWFISGDLGMCKPSPEIYRLVVEQVGVEPRDIVFVDDRPRNLDAAKTIGFDTVVLDIRGDGRDHPHRRIRQLANLL